MAKELLSEMGLNYDTPVSWLTIGQLIEILKKTTPQEQTRKDSDFVYGLNGIMELFGCGHKHAQHLKNTILKPACSQYGKLIIVDKQEAINLFKASGRTYNEK